MGLKQSICMYVCSFFRIVLFIPIRVPPFLFEPNKSNRKDEIKLKNYRNSDYALNKYSNGIVYCFENKIVEVTMADYLRENPDKTESDFLDLKALSDSIYLEQDRADNAQTKKNISIHRLEGTAMLSTLSLEEEYQENELRNQVMRAVQRFFETGTLTEKQRQRFVKHYFYGKTLRDIAKAENVHFTSVGESIQIATAKLRRFFKEV